MRKILNEELGRLSVDEAKDAKKMNFCIVLDNVRSLSNVGSVFRTADSLGVEKLFLCGITGTPPNRELHKTALGSEESVHWEYFDTTEKCVHKLKMKGYQIILIEQIEPCLSLEKYVPDELKNTAYIFGNEIDGISSEVLPLADFAIEIPQFGAKHSLNVAVTAGIVTWHHVCNFLEKNTYEMPKK